jgi:hypothetical protein
MSITRLIVHDYKGKYGRDFARAGEMVYAYHPKHAEDEEAHLFPESGGIMFLYGGDVSEALDLLAFCMEGTLDFVQVRSKDPVYGKEILAMSKAVGDDTYIAMP